MPPAAEPSILRHLPPDMSALSDSSQSFSLSFQIPDADGDDLMRTDLGMGMGMGMGMTAGESDFSFGFGSGADARFDFAGAGARLGVHDDQSMAWDITRDEIAPALRSPVKVTLRTPRRAKQTLLPTTRDNVELQQQTEQEEEEEEEEEKEFRAAMQAQSSPPGHCAPALDDVSMSYTDSPAAELPVSLRSASEDRTSTPRAQSPTPEAQTSPSPFQASIPEAHMATTEAPDSSLENHTSSDNVVEDTTPSIPEKQHELLPPDEVAMAHQADSPPEPAEITVDENQENKPITTIPGPSKLKPTLRPPKSKATVRQTSAAGIPKPGSMKGPVKATSTTSARPVVARTTKPKPVPVPVPKLQPRPAVESTPSTTQVPEPQQVSDDQSVDAKESIVDVEHKESDVKEELSEMREASAVVADVEMAPPLEEDNSTASPHSVADDNTVALVHDEEEKPTSASDTVSPVQDRTFDEADNQNGGVESTAIDPAEPEMTAPDNTPLTLSQLSPRKVALVRESVPMTTRTSTKRSASAAALSTAATGDPKAVSKKAKIDVVPPKPKPKPRLPASGTATAARKRRVVSAPAPAPRTRKMSVSVSKAPVLPRSSRASSSKRPEWNPGLGASASEAGPSRQQTDSMDAGFSGSTATTAAATSKAYTIPDFKAMHASQAARYSLRRSHAAPTVPVPIAFSTDQRVRERQAFDAKVREREQAEEAQRERDRKDREQMEEMEARESRKRAVVRAHEVPEWYKDAPKRKGL
ncbi:unnamed protein product [Mycena citricolor]|uniref:TPX2 C-terminal domain-containing protein n=1 Tax=Mycena citricolor TaxID=2018698 RepID=A0AAD2GYG1_9AGAR|nr:unnamed protein product [Mycena citricolor]